MGKLISLETADTGSRCMVITGRKKEISKTVETQGRERVSKKAKNKSIFKSLYEFMSSNIEFGFICLVRKQNCVTLTEVVCDHEETLERLLGFSNEVNKIL